MTTARTLRTVGILALIAAVGVCALTALQISRAWDQVRSMSVSVNLTEPLVPENADQRTQKVSPDSEDEDIAQANDAVAVDHADPLTATRRRIPDGGRLTMEANAFTFDGAEVSLEDAIEALLNDPDQAIRSDAYEYLEPYLYR